MRVSSLTLPLVAVGALVGCQIGCDGERAHKPVTPHPLAPGDGGIPGVGASAVAGQNGLPGQPGQPGEHGPLDVAPGSLDQLFAGLAAAEKGDPRGRVDIVIFGDSHTAGDAMTSRWRSIWQQRFGDAGRGVVGAGKLTWK